MKLFQFVQIFCFLGMLFSSTTLCSGNDEITFVTVGLGNVGKYVTKFAVEKGMKCVGGVNKQSHIGEDVGDYVGLESSLGVAITKSEDLEQLLKNTKPNIIFHTIHDSPQVVAQQYKMIASLSNQENNPNGEYFNVITSLMDYWYPFRSVNNQDIVTGARELDSLFKSHKTSILATGVQDILGDSLLPGLLAIMDQNKLRRVQNFMSFNLNAAAYQHWALGPSVVTAMNVSKSDELTAKQTLLAGMFGEGCAQWMYRLLDPNGHGRKDDNYLQSIIKSEDFQCEFRYDDTKSVPCFGCQPIIGKHPNFIEPDYSIGAKCVKSVQLNSGFVVSATIGWGLYETTDEFTLGWTFVDDNDSETVVFQDINDGYVTARALVARTHDAIKRSGIVTTDLAPLRSTFKDYIEKSFISKGEKVEL